MTTEVFKRILLFDRVQSAHRLQTASATRAQGRDPSDEQGSTRCAHFVWPHRGGFEGRARGGAITPRACLPRTPRARAPAPGGPGVPVPVAWQNGRTAETQINAHRQLKHAVYLISKTLTADLSKHAPLTRTREYSPNLKIQP